MRIVVLHAGGLGDLVLIEALLAALRDRYSQARIELVCRADAAPVVALHRCPPDAVHPFAFDPYRWALPDDGVALQARTLLPRLEGAPVDLFISAELRATWLSEILAAALAPRDAAIADPTRPSGSDLSILLGRLGLGRNHGVRRGVGAAGTPHELERYARLAGLDGMRTPQLRRPADGASSGELAVFPISAGRLNRWRLADLAEATRSIAAAHGLTPVLIGSADDGADLEAALAGGGFGPNARVVTGSPADLPEIAARIAAASGYVGVDTGLAHLAAAYELPGVTVYGGGTWPRYAPWGKRSAGVVAPIPCFGCNWDCAFERAFCIEGVDVASVVAAFAAAYAGDAGGSAVRELAPYGPRERELFAAAAEAHRVAQRDRTARLSAITRLRDLLVRYARRAATRRRRTDAQLASLTQATTSAARRFPRARRDSAAEAPIPGEAQPWGGAALMTDSNSNSTVTAVGAAAQAAAAITRAVDDAAEQIAILNADVAARDGQIEQLQEVCDDRQRVIVEIGDHAQTYRRAAEERAGLVAALDFELGRLRDDLARAERERDEAVSAAEAATLALDEERDRTRMARAQNAADLRAAQRDAESVRARAGVLEEALEARSRLIDELQSTCEERLALVDGLGAEVTSLRAVAEERLLLIETNESKYRAREAQLAAAGETRADGVDWREIAEERARALQDVTVEAERRAVLLAELTSALEGKTREIDDLRKRLTPTS